MTAKFNSNARTKSISKSAARATRPRQPLLACSLSPGYDWFYLYYRDRALCLMLGVTPTKCFSKAWARRTIQPRAGGRCPRIGAIKRTILFPGLRRRGRNGCRRLAPRKRRSTTNRFPKALEQAEAAPLGEAVRHHRDEVVCVSGGEGSTSEGEFWEAINTACLRKLPVIFLVEDNGYAISVPCEVQTSGRKHLATGGKSSRLAHRGLRWDGPAGKLMPRRNAR